MPSTRRVCVFCGSSPGTNPAFAATARELGAALADGGVGLVYGGAQVGLMGAVADAVLDGGGDVIGVIPEGLVDREIAHPGLSELLVVGDMHERKKAMYARADAFVALPGGYGTFEEVFEATTWNQLGLHESGRIKPLYLVDVDGFWSPLVAFLDRAVHEGFVKMENRRLIGRVAGVAELTRALALTSSR